jgi:hypothetical protein
MSSIPIGAGSMVELVSFFSLHILSAYCSTAKCNACAGLDQAYTLAPGEPKILP